MGHRANAGEPAPKVWEIPADTWRRAEEAAGEIIRALQPTEETRERRRLVADHVKKLVEENTGSEVFLVGSVPQETYLPDGDIDMTAICDDPDKVEGMANRLLSVFREEEKKGAAAEYAVKDAELIYAKVKYLRCLVQNIEINISFNKLGALRKRCFIEKVDRHIGHGHLFKRSIILIKAWCYYESRILQSSNALIGTYALEIMILYMFHLYDLSISGPLEVLYRFLCYYSDFNWNDHYISLKGAVGAKSSPNVPLATENEGVGGLLSLEFLERCVKLLSVQRTKVIQEHPMIIIDPLDVGNNLGLSVSKGNCVRIPSAFKYGVSKLAIVLLSPKDEITDQINEFFEWTRFFLRMDKVLERKTNHDT